MVLGKAIDENGKSTDLLFDSQLPRNASKIILNPMLEYFFSVDNLLSGNMRYTMLGTELSDPLKYNDYNSAKGAFISDITQRINSSEDNQERRRLQDIKSKAMSIDFKNSAIQNMEFLSENVPTLFHAQEANLWNTSNKRANIVSATMIPFMLGTQQGISRNINAATIEDIGAHVWNFKGRKIKILMLWMVLPLLILYKLYLNLGLQEDRLQVWIRKLLDMLMIIEQVLQYYGNMPHMLLLMKE